MPRMGTERKPGNSSRIVPYDKGETGLTQGYEATVA